MKIQYRLLSIIALITLSFYSTPNARADHLALGAGVIHLSNPSETEFEVGGEYEYNLNAFFGVGAQVNYIFSTPSITLLGAPEGFVHPLGGDWYISGSPLFEFASGMSTQVGARFGTRVPLPLGFMTLIPSVAVDFIGGGTDYMFGLGISI